MEYFWAGPDRGKLNVDGSPNSVRQSDFWNCGIFAATNALCLAFSYDLLRYDLPTKKAIVNKMQEKKRPRMACELFQGGFKPPHFKYDLIEPSASSLLPSYPSEILAESAKAEAEAGVGLGNIKNTPRKVII